MKSLFLLRWCSIVALTVAISRPDTLYGHEDHKTEKTVDYAGISLDEKTGKKADLAASFLDENGSMVTMGSALTRPTLVLPVYYRCTESCGLLIGNLAAAINEVALKPGKDYNVIALSIDEEDTPNIALRTKKSFSRILTKGFPNDSWRYLTGTEGNIRLFTDSVGFKFKKTAPHAFIHPNVLIVLAKDGTIIRYLPGPIFLPFDVGMALTEAERGTPSISIRKLASYCFTYDPREKSYRFTAIRFIVAGVIVLMGAIMLFLIIRKKEPR